MRRLSTLILFASLALPTLAHAQKTHVEPDRVEVEKASPFDQGKVRLSLGGGLVGDQFSISGNVGVFVYKGLEAYVDGSTRFGGDAPSVGILGPGVRYIVWQIPKFHPYAGAFYRHWFVGDDLPDLDSVGARLGAMLYTDPLVIEGGVVYESFLNCDGDDCSDVYPEFSFGIVF